MKLQDYFQRLEEKRATENLSLLCLKEKHKDIAKEVNLMIKKN